jgi:hypothetical protein
MIRVYLDWNIVSNYKQLYNQDLRDFITANKQYLLFPYSSAHFTDLMKSYNPENKLFYEDLKNLEYLSEKHLLRWEENHMNLLFATPSEYFNFEKDKTNISDDFNIDEIFDDLDDVSGEFGFDIGNNLKSFYSQIPLDIGFNEKTESTLKKMFPNLNSNSSFLDFMKEWSVFMQKLLSDGNYYKNLRKDFGSTGVKVEKNAGNWEEEDVINNIDKLLISFELDFNFREFVELMFEHNKESKNLYTYFTTAYLLLDMLGYKQDKLKKSTDNVQNIMADAEHAFYAAHCDYFVATDKNLRKKAKVLYSEFNISTKVLAPDEFIIKLKDVIHDLSVDANNIIEKGCSFMDENKVLKVFEEKNHAIDLYVGKLPIFYFNFFNHVIYHHYKEEKCIVLTFVKRFGYFPRDSFYTEYEILFDNIIKTVGDIGIDLEVIRKSFIHRKMEKPIGWTIPNGFISLELEEEYNRPALKYYIQLS